MLNIINYATLTRGVNNCDHSYHQAYGLSKRTRFKFVKKKKNEACLVEEEFVKTYQDI